MEYPPGFGPPGDPPRLLNPQREEETESLTGRESKEPPGFTRPQTEADEVPSQANPNVSYHFGIAETSSGINPPRNVSPFVRQPRNCGRWDQRQVTLNQEAQKIGNWAT